MTEEQIREIEFMARRLTDLRTIYSRTKENWVAKGGANSAEEDKFMRGQSEMVTEYGWNILDKLCDYVK